MSFIATPGHRPVARWAAGGGRRMAVAAALLVVATSACSAASTAPPTSGAGGAGRAISVVAAENDWASIASQIGGTHVRVTSIINDPNADPHVYEPTPADGRAVASAGLVWSNGIGYDTWMAKLLAADPGKRAVLKVGAVIGVGDGANPHRWYNPGDVQRVIAAYVADLSRLDPGDAGYFAAQARQFNEVALKDYNGLVAGIRATYGGTPVGASESIFSMLAPALGLKVLTPEAFLRAISNGTDVSAGDKAITDGQIRNRLIKVYVYNSQNTTPDIQAQVAQCRALGIPTATITETLTPASASYQEWQSGQLRGIEAALARAVGGAVAG